jgi:malonate transporter and related proteins
LYHGLETDTVRVSPSAALPAGFFRVLFGLRVNTSSDVAGTTPIASTILSAATLAAAIYLTAGIGQQ